MTELYPGEIDLRTLALKSQFFREPISVFAIKLTDGRRFILRKFHIYKIEVRVDSKIYKTAFFVGCNDPEKHSFCYYTVVFFDNVKTSSSPKMFSSYSDARTCLATLKLQGFNVRDFLNVNN